MGCIQGGQGLYPARILHQGSVLPARILSRRLSRTSETAPAFFLEIRSRLKGICVPCCIVDIARVSRRRKRLRPIQSSASSESASSNQNGLPWDRVTQVAAVLGAAVCWFILSKSNPSSPFLSVTAAVSGISKEGVPLRQQKENFDFENEQLQEQLQEEVLRNWLFEAAMCLLQALLLVENVKEGTFQYMSSLWFWRMQGQG